jgi:hypothetical protein
MSFPFIGRYSSLSLTGEWWECDLEKVLGFGLRNYQPPIGFIFRELTKPKRFRYETAGARHLCRFPAPKPIPMGFFEVTGWLDVEAA